MILSLTKTTLAVLATSTLLWDNKVYAFAPISPSTTRAYAARSSSKATTGIFQSTIAANGEVNVNGASNPNPTAWDCDEEANCVQVEACDEIECRTTLDVRIHNVWYDLSGEFARWMDGRTAAS